jgi:hypothetical protein
MEHFPKVNDDDDENTLPWFWMLEEVSLVVAI